MLRYTVLLHKNEDVPGFSALVPELPGCFSQGLTVEDALAQIKEAIECHLDAIAEAGEGIPVEGEPFILAFVDVEPSKGVRAELAKGSR